MNSISYCLAGMTLLMLAMEAQAATMRCDRGLIATGDTILDVMEKCGEPDSRQVNHPDVDAAGQIVQGAATVEHWLYGPTHGMSYHLRFIDGRLVQIRSQR